MKFSLCVILMTMFAAMDLQANDQPTPTIRVESETGITHSFLALGAQTYIMSPSGKKTWTYPAVTRDGFVLPDDKILLVLSKQNKKDAEFPGGGVIILDKEGKISFTYKGTQSEVNTAQLLENGNIMLTEAGPKPRLLEVDSQGKIVLEFPLKCQLTNHHMQSRMSRKLTNGNYLVPQLHDFAVHEYDNKGNILNTISTKNLDEKNPETWPFTSIYTPEKHILITCTHGNQVIEVDQAGKIVWRLTNQDLPGPWLQDPCGAQRLENGNTVITSYAAGQANLKGPKLLEVTPDKKVVWAFYNQEKAGIHHFQILDTNGQKLKGMPLK